MYTNLLNGGRFLNECWMIVDVGVTTVTIVTTCIVVVLCVGLCCDGGTWLRLWREGEGEREREREREREVGRKGGMDNKGINNTLLIIIVLQHTMYTYNV